MIGGGGGCFLRVGEGGVARGGVRGRLKRGGVVGSLVGGMCVCGMGGVCGARGGESGEFEKWERGWGGWESLARMSLTNFLYFPISIIPTILISITIITSIRTILAIF